MTRIRGKNDGPDGRYEHYDVGTRKNAPRAQIVKVIGQGKHPGAHMVSLNGRKYARDNPDGSTKDNVKGN